MQTTETKCELGVCNGQGWYTTQNGYDDFDTEYCLCEIGQKLEEENV